MSNRGIGRARMFVGGFILAAAVIVWGTGMLTSPHGTSIAEGTEHVRTTIVVYLRNVAFATIGLSILAAILLFPARRPRMAKRDWLLGGIIAVLVVSSLYHLLWLETSMLN